MAESVASYPHKTRLNVLHAPLELIDEKASIVRMAVIQGEYHWHHHTDDDEFFYVVEGRLLIDAG